MTPTVQTKKRVLVVDNNNLVADTLAMVLLRAGFNAIAIYDPVRALALAKDGSFDLLLTDVVLPGMSGIDLAIQVREDASIPNILLISGTSATSDLLEEARERGYEFDILPKPLGAQEIIDKVREALGISSLAS